VLHPSARGAVAARSGAVGGGLAEDVHGDIIDRFRGLRMSQSAVHTGRTIADRGRNATAAAVIAVGCGDFSSRTTRTEVCGAGFCGIMIVAFRAASRAVRSLAHRARNLIDDEIVM